VFKVVPERLGTVNGVVYEPCAATRVEVILLYLYYMHPISFTARYIESHTPYSAYILLYVLLNKKTAGKGS
jgi:hypothetical protein